MATDVQPAPDKVSLEAKSPFEMRVHLGEDVPGNRRPHARSRPATWASCTASRPARRSTARAFASSPGRPPACSAANIATTPTPGRLRNGIPVTLEQAIEEVRKYANGLKAMNGGFTLSGGEPLMQDRFAARLFAAVKAMGVHTAIETNGFYGERLVRRGARATSISSSST